MRGSFNFLERDATRGLIFGFPGSENDTPQVLEFLRVLREEGFFRPDDPLVLSFEVKPWKDEDAEITLANAKRVLNRAWALLED
jgi:hypothetical protein